MIRVFAFDIFGTLVDMSGVPKEEMRDYGEHIRKPEWSPLVLPDSWDDLDAFPDVLDGLVSIRSQQSAVVTLSNAPFMTQVNLWRVNWSRGGEWIDAIIPLELRRVFKPNPKAYECLLDCFPDFDPADICMVSGNKHFGDIEAARSLGMKAVLIRGDTGIDVSDLAGMAERGEI